MRLLIVQYGGDYREAVKRFAAGGEETYYGQKYSVDAVANVGKKADEVATLCCLTEHPYNERLENGVRAIGTGFTQKIQAQKLVGLAKQFQPTHLILRTPNTAIIRWAIQSQLKILLMLADSFNSKRLRDKIRYYQLAKLLNSSQIDWIGNHGVTAGLSLANIGVNPNKIIPWDWPYEMTPHAFTTKNLQLHQETYEIFYVGLVIESKGIGDVIKAVAQLKTQGLSVRLKIAGKGDIERFKNQARDLKIENSVEFLGLVPNKTIVPLMREADLVVVPSRHEYAEGFPKSINEALYSRTPIVASDHPMFLKKLKNRDNALIFKANDPVSLAQCVKELLSDPVLYHSLSSSSYDTLKTLQIPVKWAQLMNNWLLDSPEHKQWLFEHRLSSGQYRECPNLDNSGLYTTGIIPKLIQKTLSL